MKANTIRKVLVALVLSLIPLSGFSQGFQWEMSPKYMGEIHAGYKTTTKVSGADNYSGMVELGTLQGVTLNKYLDLAVGVDAFMLTHYYSGCGLRFGMDVYFDMRPGYPLDDKTKVFLDLGLGGCFGVHSEPKMKSDFYCQFGPGIKYRKLNLSLGLQSFGTGSGAVGFYSRIGLYF